MVIPKASSPGRPQVAGEIGCKGNLSNGDKHLKPWDVRQTLALSCQGSVVSPLSRWERGSASI
jgi:hypothetical protein